MKAAVFAIYNNMDQEQGSVRGSIPRLSRLPMPRASHDNLRSLSPSRTLKPVASRDALRQANLSTLPRPRALAPKPLGESIGNSIMSRYGWATNIPDPLCDQTNVESQGSSENLDTTPPGPKNVFPVFDEASENAGGQDVVVDENATPKPEIQKENRRPRPSLSERTAETLSQLSPSPSSSRRRSRTSSIDSIMGPPSRPASVMKATRTPNSFSVRATSPTKSLRAPASIANTKRPLSSPSVQSPGPIYTPPKAHMRGRSTHIAKPPTFSSATVTESHHASSHKHSATMSKDSQIAGPKFSRPTKTVDGRTSPVKPPLASIFKDPPKKKLTSSKLDLSSINTKPKGLMRPKTRGENALASSPTSSPASAKPRAEPVVKKHAPVKPPGENSGKAVKSSAALREQLATAKADAMKKTASRAPSALEIVEETSFIIVDNKGVLKKRIQGAVTTGSLNISAMGLKQIPDEVMKMFDFDESSNFNWSEAVDLLKLQAADNELQELRPDSFPDWSPEDLAADEEKSNQFAGLEVLDLHGNQLQEIPVGFRRLERLQTLNLSKNKLSSEAMGVVCQIKNLKELNLASNALSGTLLENIGQLTNLEVLDLSSNQLEVLPASISNLTKLKKLNVSGNKFASLSFELFSSLPLVEIIASKNKLSGILLPSGATLEKLQVLDISGNSLEAITSSTDVSMPKLITFTTDRNRLSSLPDVSSMSKLVTLSASGNKLNEFPTGFDKLTAIKNADLSNNNIKTVCDCVAQMETLATLNLAGNPLRERKYLTMSTEDLKLDLAKRLAPANSSTEDAASTSTLATNIISNTASSSSTLSTPINGTLDLSSKSLVSIDLSTIDLSTPIHTLNLSANNITHIPIDLLTHPSIQPALKNLDLSHNPLASTTYLTHALTLPNLKTLNIISTTLSTLDPLTTHLKAPTLTTLNISCHRLNGHLPWPRAFWPSVTTLLATDNWFGSIDVEAVRGLQVLDVRNNEIECLPAKLGMLGANPSKKGGDTKGKLRVFECAGNRFRVPRWDVVERGTEAVLRDLRRMVPAGELEGEWADE
jgi:Leucine-rich repeat (LRR) protein